MTDLVQTAVHQLTMDASQYQREAGRVDDANESMVASVADVQREMARVGRATLATADGYDRIAARMDPLIRLEQRRARAMAQINLIEYENQGTSAQAARTRELVVANFERQEQAIRRARGELDAHATAAEKAGLAFRQLVEQQDKFHSRRTELLRQKGVAEEAFLTGAVSDRQAMAEINRITAELRSLTPAGQAAAQAERDLAEATRLAAVNAERESRELEQLMLRHSSAYRVENEHARTIAELNRLRASGRLGEREYSEAVAQSAVALRRARGELGQHGESLRLQAHQLTNLSYQFQDVFVSLAGGTNPLTVLIQQGPQITSAVGGVSNAFALLRGMLTPVRVGIGLITTAAVAGTAAWWQYDNAMIELEKAFQISGNRMGLTAGDVARLVDSVRAGSQLTKTELQGLATGFLATGNNSRAAMTAMMAVTDDFAASLGIGLDEAQKKLTGFMKDPAKGAEELNNLFNLMTAAEMDLVRGAATATEKTKAWEMVLDRLGARLDGLAKREMTVFTQAIHGISDAWHEMQRAGHEAVQGAEDYWQAQWKRNNRVGGVLPAKPESMRLSEEAKRAQRETSDLARSLRPLQTQIEESEGRIRILSQASLEKPEQERNRLEALEAETAYRDNLMTTVQRQIADYRLEAEALKISANAREKFLAVERAKRSPEKMSADERGGLADAAGAAVTARQSAAWREQIEGIHIQVAAQQRLAEAYAVSLGAGQAMESQIAAEAAWRQNAAVGVQAYAKALNEERAAKDAAQAQLTLRGVDREIGDLNAQIAAIRQSRVEWDALSGSYRVNDRELKVVLETQKLIGTNARMGWEEARTAAERYVEAQESLREAQDESIRQMERQNAIVREFAQFGEQVFDRVGGAMTEMFVQGKTGAFEWRNVMLGVVSEIGQEFVKLAMINPIKNALAPALGTLLGGLFGGISGGFGGGGGGGVLVPGVDYGPQVQATDILFPKPMAEGGPVSPGKVFLVGEEGPELFIPPMAGTIIPNHQLGGASPPQVNITQNITINAQGADRSVIPSLQAALAQVKAQAVNEAIGAMFDIIGKGGGGSRSVGLRS